MAISPTVVECDKRKVTAVTIMHECRTALWNTIGALLDAFSPAECRNYLANCGYGAT